MKKSIIAGLTCIMLVCGGCGMYASTEETPTSCEKAGCSEPVYKYNLCTDHYVESELAMERCSIAGCSRPIYKDALCAEHYVERELEQSKTGAEGVTEKQENMVTVSPEPTEVPTSTVVDTPTQEPTVTNTPIPTSTPTPTPEPTSTPIPTATPKPTNTPKPTATLVPTKPASLTAEDIYEMAIASVVEITGKSSNGTSTGTGFFSDKNGTVVTNFHVIDGCSTATITLSDGKTYEVKKVLGYNESKDIAILSINCTSSIPLQFRKSNVKTGETVYAIGSSLGLEGSLSDGIVSTAEREVDGNVYIQTTAPISHGNSGGPLLDKDGYVVGITSASFVDGQNLNLAIPIAEVNGISTKNPVTLAELFKANVEWLSDWDFFYYDEMEYFVFVFHLADENKNPIRASGTVELSISNNDGVVVYEGSGDFNEEFYEDWTYGDSTEKNLVTFYIAPEDIDVGTTAKGTVSFIVYGDDYSFEETEIEVTDLPTEPMQVYCNDLPFVVNEYGYFNDSLYASATVNEIFWEVVYGDSLLITFNGEKTYDKDGTSGTNSCQFNWRLYDEDNYLVDSGWVYLSNLMTGDKFKEEAYSWNKIEEGKSYTIVLTEVER